MTTRTSGPNHHRNKSQGVHKVTNNSSASSSSSSKLKNSSSSTSTWSPSRFLEVPAGYLEKYGNVNFMKRALTDPLYTWWVGCGLLLIEICINAAIIIYRPYTEIDWKAYMQEVEGFLNGTLDYQYLKGDTGPLVYPAGFVYVYSLMYFATNHGTNIKIAQWIFGGLYILMLYQVFRIYSKSKKVPPYALIFLALTSYRIHSIFVLRLFNDPIAIILLYIAINCFLEGRWTFGSLAFSFAVSVKMNVLLYAPALLLIYLTQLTLFDTLVQLTVCGSLQVVLALPFLLVNPWSYISRSFDLSRVFLYEWTVNWKFLSEELFLNRYFHFGLLATHILILALFVPSWLRYLRSYYKIDTVITSLSKKDPAESVDDNITQHPVLSLDIRSQLILLPLFTCNFIGVIFSRSLHYQFYIWYYHTIPYLLWSTKLPDHIKLVLFGIIELTWNIFPANPFSSCTLFLVHLTILGGIWLYKKSPSKEINLNNRVNKNKSLSKLK